MENNILEVKDLSISFGGIKAVQHLNFNIKKGEILALIGPNGSGKSTTVNLVSGVYLQDGGSIVFNNHDVPNKMSIAKRARLGIGRTFQTPKPFANLTVYENVFNIAVRDNSYLEAKEKTLQILNDMDLYKYRDIESGRISIEKRKWIDLARILTIDPKLIMLDELMAGLNPSEMEESLNLIRKINAKGITILFIEHVMKAVVSICSRSIVLNQGMLLAEGKPVDVLNDPLVIDAYLGGE